MSSPRRRPTGSGSTMRRRAHPRASRRRGVVQRPARRMVVQRMRASQGGEGGHWAAQPRGARLAAGTGSRRARPTATCPRDRVANAPGSGRPGGKETRRKQPVGPRRREGGKGNGALAQSLGAQRGGWRSSANTTAAGANARTVGARASALSPPSPRRLLPPPLLPPRPAAPWRVCYPGPRARRGGPRPAAARARCEPAPPRLCRPAPPLPPLRCAPPPAPPAPPAPPRAASGRLQRAPPTPARTAGTRAPPGCRGARRRGGRGGRGSGRSGGRARACGALTRRTRGSRRRRHRRGRGPGAAGWRGARRTRTWLPRIW